MILRRALRGNAKTNGHPHTEVVDGADKDFETAVALHRDTIRDQLNLLGPAELIRLHVREELSEDHRARIHRLHNEHVERPREQANGYSH